MSEERVTIHLGQGRKVNAWERADQIAGMLYSMMPSDGTWEGAVVRVRREEFAGWFTVMLDPGKGAQYLRFFTTPDGAVHDGHVAKVMMNMYSGRGPRDPGWTPGELVHAACVRAAQTFGVLENDNGRVPAVGEAIVLREGDSVRGWDIKIGEHARVD